jgi:hypothetical protein
VRIRLLLIIMGVLVIVVYGTLAILVVAMGGSESAEAPPPGEEATPNLVETAREYYPAAVTEAQTWQTDAQLVSATASWSNVESEEDLQRPATWGYTFFSPQTRLVQVLSVTPDGAEQVQTLDATATTRGVDTSLWQVDSEQVLSLFLDSGGRDFLAQHPGATVTLRVGLDESGERLVWYAMGIYSPERATLVVTVDATTGELLSRAP